MLVNLKAEMARFGISQEQIAQKIGRTKRSLLNRLDGVIEISGDDLRTIRDEFFPTFTLDYLLSEEPIVLKPGTVKESTSSAPPADHSPA